MSKSNALLKLDVIPAELKQLWAHDDSKVEHYEKFVFYCQKQIRHVFPSVDWSTNVWEISEYESTQSARRVSHDSNVLFTRFNGLGKQKKIAAEAQEPFTQPFRDLVKGIIVLNHLGRAITHDAHMVWIRAFRYLYHVFTEHQLQAIHQINGLHFDLAMKMAMDRNEAESTLYRTGEHLSAIADKLNLFGLCMVFEWHNPIPRPDKTGGTEQRHVRQKTSLPEAEQLPKSAYLTHLAALWKHYDELQPSDKIHVCMGIVSLCTGLRMDEFCGLHVGCIPSKEEYESAPLELTFDGRVGKMLRMSVLARKRFVWDSKIIPNSLTDTVFLAVDRLKALSTEARYYALMLLNESYWPALDGFDEDEIVLATDLAAHFKLEKTSNLITQLGRLGITRHISSAPKRTTFCIRDIHQGVSRAYREELKSVADGFGPQARMINYWDLLTLQFKFEHSRGSIKMFPIPVSGTQIQDAFRGRNYISRLSKEEKRIETLFERYQFDGLVLEPGGIRTHQFRHLLNTVLQQSAQFDQEDIAKFFLRAGVRDNEWYDHSSSEHLAVQGARKLHEFQAKFAPKFESKNNELDASQVVGLISRFPLLGPEELMAELESRGSSHVMRIGRCRHDYTQEPCGKHYACLNKCKHYRRQKGNPLEIARLHEMKAEAELQVAAAQFDTDDGLTNAHVWLAHHQRLLAGCDAALSIEQDDRYEVGQIVAIFPNGRDSCEAF